MSRRRAFETSLSSSSTPQSSDAHSGSSDSKGKGKNKSNGDANSSGASAKAARAPPAISPPVPSLGSATVPSETSAEKSKALAKAPSPAPLPDEGEGDESELCFICAEPVTFYSVGVCGHRTCHVCAVRLRTFYKKTECTFCKTPAPSILFSRSAETPFPEEHHRQPSPANVIAAALENADKLPKGERWDRGLTLPGTLDLGSFAYTDDKLGVVFEDEAMMEETLLLLRFNCPYEGCAHMAHDWPSLEQHTLKTHGLVICTLCRKQLSRFAHEQVLYPPHLLALHDPSRLARGQRPPKPRGDEVELVKDWEAPHPMCEFCHQAFFGPDELFKHMRERHEECFVCRQMGEKNVYYQNYAKLEQHFNADHHPCSQPVCLEKKFVVFPSEMDLRAHMVAEHSEAMSARDRANMRHLPVEFQDASRRRGGGGRGFTTGSETAAGPSTMRRDGVPQHQQIGQAPPMAPAQAAQARRAAQVDRQEESKRRRAFDTGLTGGLAANQDGASGRSGAGASRSGFATPREDVDDATAGRHAALLSRIALLVQGSDNKLSSFRSAVRQFKHNESSAKDMIDTIYNVLDQDTESTVGVLREVAGLFDDEEKSRTVLEAVNAFRITQRDQFPALATPTGLGSNYAGITSGAILNAKRATQSHRRGSSSQNVWDRVEAAAANQPVNRPAATTGVNGRVVPGAAFGFASGSRAGLNASAFPSLGAGPAGLGKGKGSASGSGHSTPWAGGGAGGSSKTPSALTGVIRSTPTSGSAFPSIGSSTSSAPKTSSAASSRPAKPPSAAAFPALPNMSAAQQAREERRALFSKPTPSQESVRRITGQAAAAPPPTGSGWGAAVTSPNGVGSMSDEMMALQIAQEEARAAGQEKKGKKGKGKQLLFQVSARPT